mmetsp:Transcript_67642/g.171236  ORF Transcript_67642/g.171236 Transcript_67642/m.171236 type:complete len:569 (+) Transcript_67642:80-1786(+)
MDLAAAAAEEGQALRDQIRDLQHLLQVKDAEIGLKYTLLQAKERENGVARRRLQWLETQIPQMLAAEAAQRASGVLNKELLLTFNSAIKLLGLSEVPCDRERLSCVSKADLGLHDLDFELPETPSATVGTRTPLAGSVPPTPSGASAAGSQMPPSPAASASGKGRKNRGSENGGAGKLVWKPCAKAAPTANGGPGNVDDASSAVASPSPPSETSSPGRQRAAPPPALDMLNEAELSSSKGAPATASQPPESTPNKRLPITDPDTGKLIEENKERPVQTPSKRLAIVDPASGKEIEVTPNTEVSKIKPTMVSVESISEGRKKERPPLSPAGPLAPPLTLPPVVAGAPPQMRPPLVPPYACPSLPPGAPTAGMPSGALPPMPAVPGLQGLPPGFPPPPGPGWPPPPPGGTPSGLPGSMPPPPHHPPVVRGDASARGVPESAARPVAGISAASAGAGAAGASCIAERLIDALGGVPGGPVQMARGPLGSRGAQVPPAQAFVGLHSAPPAVAAATAPATSSLLGFAGYPTPPSPVATATLPSHPPPPGMPPPTTTPTLVPTAGTGVAGAGGR